MLPVWSSKSFENGNFNGILWGGRLFPDVIDVLNQPIDVNSTKGIDDISSSCEFLT